MGVELFISEIKGSVLDNPVPHQNVFKLMFITSHLSFEYHGIHYSNTESHQITGNYHTRLHKIGF